MRRSLALLACLAATVVPAVALAQASPDIVIRGTRDKPSGWREAETSHVILLSDGNERDLIRLSRNLERLHFLLSGLLGRGDVADDTVKLRVTLIGDVAEFDAMQLQNKRWQQGPFNDLFQISRYYDPREDGAVMASARIDQRTVIERTPVTAQRIQGVLSGLALGRGGNPADQAALNSAIVGDFATASMIGAHDLGITFGENAIQVPAESLLYAGYAQHFLLTYFPAAYPRWYLDGFGQIFASFEAKGETMLEYGRSPRGTSAVLAQFGSFPLARIFDDSYLTDKPGKTRWTPIHAWLLTHFLLFNDARRPQLRRYLAARAAGTDAVTAAAAFGDQKTLASDLRRYFGARKPFDQVTYPADKIEQPALRRLSEGQAAFVKGRLEMGARVLVPSPPTADDAPDRAKAITSVRTAALKARDQWLQRLRRDAARWSGEVGAQLLLAEAECRSGNAAECEAAAKRAAALAPTDPRPKLWQGVAMVAAAGDGPDRAARLAAARKLITSANRADVDAVMPLIAYHASFAGLPVPTTAIDALQKAVERVPDAPATRLRLATALADRGQPVEARQVILPVAIGAYDSPERPAAQALAASTAPVVR